MAQARRCFLLVLLFLAGISTQRSGASENGYLQTVGPPRLRFSKPAVRPEVDPLLEINLAITAPTPTNAEPERAGNPDVATVVVTNAPSIEPVPTTPNAADPETSTAASGPPQPGSNIQGVMPQPQLFLQYFTPEYLPGTNGFGFGFGLPVSFFPPQPWRTANSSATYQTIPPEKP